MIFTFENHPFCSRDGGGGGGSKSWIAFKKTIWRYTYLYGDFISLRQRRGSTRSVSEAFADENRYGFFFLC